MKNDVKKMGVKYEKEMEEVDKSWQEMLKSAERERGENKKRRLAAEEQAQTDRDKQKRQHDSLMNQMKIERENADRTRWGRDEAEKRSAEAETQAQMTLALQQERLDEVITQMKIENEEEEEEISDYDSMGWSMSGNDDFDSEESDNESGYDWWYDSEEGDYD